MRAEMIQQGTRRVHERTNFHVEVTFESDHNFFMGFSENISEGGLFIATHSLREAGTRLPLTFELPGGRVIHATGEVRWVRVYGESNDAPPGLGLRFLDLAPDDANAIAAFVQQRDPIFYE